MEDKGRWGQRQEECGQLVGKSEGHRCSLLASLENGCGKVKNLKKLASNAKKKLSVPHHTNMRYRYTYFTGLDIYTRRMNQQ